MNLSGCYSLTQALPMWQMFSLPLQCLWLELGLNAVAVVTGRGKSMLHQTQLSQRLELLVSSIHAVSLA